MKRILILDDDREMATLWKLIFEREGYAVFSTGKVQEAQDWLAESSYDLLIMQGGIPVFDWWQFYKLLRTNAAFKTLRVLILLNKLMPIGGNPKQVDEVRNETRSYGDEIVTELIDIKDLREIIKRLLGSDNGFATPQIQ